MKRGCFFGFSFIIILIGIVFYIGEKYGPQIYDYGHKKVTQFYNEKIESELNNISGAYSDSVKVFLQKKMDALKDEQIRLTKNQLEKLKKQIGDLSKKSIIDSTDFNQLKRIFK